MAKNIVLCADGTGNKGGYTPDSNVFKIYEAIDLYDDEVEQIAFYDNGVGTQTVKYIRALSGALGFGFEANVCDLYEYLARHYDPGDKIYMFGFSRGAATIRAFNGFVHACGLIDGRGKGNKELKSEVKLAVTAYSKEESQRDNCLSDVTMHAETPKIEFIGVWDTVSALGFPERTAITGLFTFILNFAFYWAGVIADKLFPHKFYDYELTPNVINACQAIAIDDERTSFWPMVWQEGPSVREHTNVLQVWFCGMHSNVGGGYERSGLANVSFLWMLNQFDGLKLKRDVLPSARDDANVNGRMYDSRHGFAAYYRYHPRQIKTLCSEANTTVKIHESVMHRMTLRTANYAPKLLPDKFEVVDDKGVSTESPDIHLSHWQLFRRAISGWILFRKWQYGILLELTVVVVAAAYYFWLCPPVSNPDKRQGIIDHAADILEYFTPQFFDGLIEVAVVQQPYYAIAGGVIICIYLGIRNFAHRMTTDYAERLRKLFIIAPRGYPGLDSQQ